MIKNDHNWRLTMKKRILSVLTAACLFNSGCTGGEFGFVATVIGIPALIGGLIGAGLGSAVGKSNSSTHVIPLICSHEKLSLADVVRMSQTGASNERIIAALISTHTRFLKSEINAGELRIAGVSQKVISFLFENSL